MKLPDIFKTIASVLSKPNSSLKFKTITEESIRGQIEDARWALTTAEAAFEDLSEQQLNTLYSKVLQKVKTDVTVFRALGKPGADFISGIDKNLKSRARSLGFFKANLTASKALVKSLDSIQEHIPELLAGKDGLIINDIQVSHGMVLGTIEASIIFSSMNSYLLVIFSHIISMGKTGSDIPKYMVDYLVKNGYDFIEIINQLNTTGSLVINSITNLKKRGADFKMNATGIQNNVVNGVLGGENIFLKVFGAGIRFIGWFGEIYTDYRHAFYERMKERKKWLETHVANIKLSLEDTDPNDPKYIETQKIVTFYDDKIAELDKQINDYYNKE